MLWQSLRALCFLPGGPGSIWDYIGEPMRARGVSRTFACGFRTDVHCADDIPKENAHHVNLEWTEDKQAKLKALVERYTSRGSSRAWRVH
jgi:hypothetical protein